MLLPRRQDPVARHALRFLSDGVGMLSEQLFLFVGWDVCVWRGDQSRKLYGSDLGKCGLCWVLQDWYVERARSLLAWSLTVRCHSEPQRRSSDYALFDRYR